MSLDKAISMGAVKQKLWSIRTSLPYLPDGKSCSYTEHPDLVYDFARYLAEKLHEKDEKIDLKFHPIDFCLFVENALYDLSRGVDGETGERLTSKLACQPPIIYEILTQYVPRIAEAACPEDYATSVRELCEEINAKMRESK